MIQLPNVKRGDTFLYKIIWEGALLAELKSQIRDSNDQLIADVVITQGVQVDEFVLTVAETNNWTLDVLYTDIQRTVSGNITSSETMEFRVEKDVTE